MIFSIFWILDFHHIGFDAQIVDSLLQKCWASELVMHLKLAGNFVN